MMCRHTRVSAVCGLEAADWLLRFSILISRISPRILDVIYYPDGVDTMPVADCSPWEFCP
jgi:hypothetical protein